MTTISVATRKDIYITYITFGHETTGFRLNPIIYMHIMDIDELPITVKGIPALMDIPTIGNNDMNS